jgi:hypothetical protein
VGPPTCTFSSSPCHSVLCSAFHQRRLRKLQGQDPPLERNARRLAVARLRPCHFHNFVRRVLSRHGPLSSSRQSPRQNPRQGPSPSLPSSLRQGPLSSPWQNLRQRPRRQLWRSQARRQEQKPRQLPMCLQLPRHMQLPTCVHPQASVGASRVTTAVGTTVTAAMIRRAVTQTRHDVTQSRRAVTRTRHDVTQTHRSVVSRGVTRRAPSRH